MNVVYMMMRNVNDLDGERMMQHLFECESFLYLFFVSLGLKYDSHLLIFVSKKITQFVYVGNTRSKFAPSLQDSIGDLVTAFGTSEFDQEKQEEVQCLTIYYAYIEAFG